MSWRRRTSLAVGLLLLGGLGTLTPSGAAPGVTHGPADAAPGRRVDATLPGGRTEVFDGHSVVAYYGTAGTPALGVLGEGSIASMTRALRRAAGPFATSDRAPQITYELIVTVADRSAGPDGDYSHDIADAGVRRFVRAAHRHDALLVLDLQPGRSDFLEVARRWRWALRDPYVGLALDPEWRMGRRQVPGEVIGHVGAQEVNRVSAWLARLTRARHLPEKAFVVHSFRSTMIRRQDALRDRAVLASVLHVDGFGTPEQKLATYRAVGRPPGFKPGFKLFYDEDTPLMKPRRVLRIRPRPLFVSYQ